MPSALSLIVALQAAEPDLHALRWMTGCWEGEAFGGRVEECWISAPDGRLTGLFQLAGEEAQTFSEFFMLADFGEGPELKLKHFNPDFTSWEADGEFTRFALIEAGPDAAVFEGLTYARLDDGTIQVDLAMQTADGARTETFVLRPMAR